MTPVPDCPGVLSRLREEPLRALIFLEIGAVLCAYAVDTVVAAGALVPHVTFTFPQFGVYTATFWMTAVALFGLPHAPNRRFARLALAVVGTCALAALPNNVVAAPVLLVILVVRLTFAFGLRGTAIAWFVAMVGAAIGTFSLQWLPHETLTPAQIAGQISIFILEITLVFGMIAIVWLYANKAAANAALAERSRIAFDLHDALGHSLTTLRVQLQNAERLRASDPQKADDYVKSAAATAADLLADVRETVALLHDNASSAVAPLPILLERLRSDFTATHSVAVNWHADCRREPSGPVTIAIYRVLQEALTNVARHARAERIDVSVLSGSDAVDLLVLDDGAGFEGAATSGHGLASMRARIEAIGGTFTIASALGGGTRIEARVPLEANA